MLGVCFGEHGSLGFGWCVGHGWGFVVVVGGIVLVVRGLGTVGFGVLPEITMA